MKIDFERDLYKSALQLILVNETHSMFSCVDRWLYVGGTITVENLWWTK